MNKHVNYANLLESNYGFRLPPALRLEFESWLEREADQRNQPFSSEEVNNCFCTEYIENNHPFEITTINFEKKDVNTEDESLVCTVEVIRDGDTTKHIQGEGNGALNALLAAFKDQFEIEFEILDYLQHGLTQGSHALAASYIQLADKDDRVFWGVGIDSDCTLSAVRALLSAINRS